MLHHLLEQSEPVANIKTFGKRTSSHNNGIIFTKDSPLINIFRKALLQLSEQGVTDKVLRRAGKFVVNQESDHQILSIGQTALAFIVLGVGAMAVSLVVLIIEVLVWKFYSPCAA